MNHFTFVVPWDAICSDNRKYVRGYILSKRYRASKKTIGALAREAALACGWQVTSGRIAIVVGVRSPDRRWRDLNFSKGLKDGITEAGGVWEDDRQVRDERWVFDDSRPPSKETAGATVTIISLEEKDVRKEPDSRIRRRHAGAGKANRRVRV